jgi:ribosome-binding protein aMBF1 (putative translation factor)
MSEHTKKHPISAQAHGSILHITHHNKIYAIPKKIAEQYVIEDKNKKSPKSSVTIKKLFERLDTKFTKAGALLKGLRLREGLSQVQFAKKINVNQANLSSMENGRRPIGKDVAKRIQKVFGADYRYFL